MEKKILFAGFGGQGVLTLGQTIALTQMNKGLNVTWIPSYGAEMRGGTANCSVIYSDENIGSPIIKKDFDVLIAMNEPSLRKFENSVVKGGLIMIESSIIKSKPTRTDVKVCSINATDIATQLGNLKVVNVVMLGAYARVVNDFTVNEAFETLKYKLKGKEKLFDINEKAINEGYRSVMF